MSDYLLPCECGQLTTVSTAQAGQAVRCTCGVELTVPTLRGLRDLAPAELPGTAAKNASRERTWDNRHRLGFVLIVASLASLFFAGYLLLQVPPVTLAAEQEEIEQWLEGRSPGEVMHTYRDLSKGLVARTADAEFIREIRSFYLRAAGVALAVGLVGLIAAVVVLLTRPKRKRSPQESTR